MILCLDVFNFKDPSTSYLSVVVIDFSLPGFCGEIVDCFLRICSIIAPQKLGKEKSMTTTYKYEVEGSFNLKTSRHNIMYNFQYSNISQFAGNL